MTDKPTMRLANEAGHLIRRCHQINQALFYDATAGFDLTPVQVSTLRFVHEYPGVGQRQLAAMMGVDEATLGGVVMRLIDRGILARAPDPADRRLKRLTVTEAGAEIDARIKPRLSILHDRLVAPLSEEDARHLTRLLRELVVAHEAVETTRVGTAQRVPRARGKRDLATD